MWRKKDEHAVALGKKGGNKTAERGSEYFRQIANMRTTYSGGRPLNYWDQQQKAQNLVTAAIRAGRIPRLSKVETACVDCGKRAMAYDHRDYSRPFEIEPVCDSCNAQRGPGYGFSGNHWGRKWTVDEWAKRCDEYKQQLKINKPKKKWRKDE